MTIPSPSSSIASFQFIDSRQKRIYVRLQLIGPGPASFYYDACRLMSLEPPLMSTTHIVSHLLREIESAFRAVVLSASGKTINANSQKKHRESIEVVLEFLEIPTNSSIGSLWLNLPDDNYGLHARAHRDALAYRPTNLEFISFWENMEQILDGVLQRFEEKYLSAHQLIEQLLTVTSPTEEDIKKLRNNVPNSPTALRIFFNSVSETWLELLKPHFFKLPPKIDPVDNTFVPWSESQFLVRASKSNPQTVLEIVLQIPDTNNPYVLDDLCDVALELPIEMAVELIPKMKGWLASHYQRLLPIKIGKFIKRLAENQNTIEALELSQELLAILPVPEIPSIGWERIRSKYDPFVYHEILEEHIFVLAEIKPMEFVVLLTNLVNDAIVSLVSVNQNPSEKDPSQWWPIFAQEHRHDDIENILIPTLYKASLHAIKKDQGSLLKIIQLFENYPWTILRRLTLYLLSQYPMASHALNTKYLTNRDLFQNFPSEYYLSLQSAFGQLQPSEQNQILDWLKDVPDDQDDHWQRHWLTAIMENLPDNWRARYDQLIQSLGEPDAFVYHSPIETYTWWGDGSPKAADDLLNMSMDELFEYLKEWQPSDELLRTSKRGLGTQLKNIVTNSPYRFAPEAARFLTVSPIYINSFLSGLRDACSNKRSFSWFPVLELCLEIINEISKNSPRDISEEWSWTCAEISDLVREGCEKDAIDFAHRELTWSVLVALVDQAPNPDDEYGRIDHNMTALELSYNTYRGRALHTVIQYLFWVQRQLRRLSNDPTNFVMSSEMVREVIKLLNQQILDNSLAVKAVFGRYIPWFDLLNRNWLAQNLKHIFVDDDIPWAAAWSAYVTTCNPYDHNFTILRNEYFRAVNAIATYDVEAKTRKSTHTIEHLIWHIMVFYERGLLNLNEPEGLLQLFYHGAPDELCAYAIQNVGQGLKNSTEPISEEILLRLYELWQYRLEQAQLAPQVHEAELLAFSWWFVSGKLDPKWSIEQMKLALTLTDNPKVVLADGIVAQLSLLSDKLSQEVVECLDIVVERTKELWKIDIWQDEIRTILVTGLNSSELVVRQKSTAFINKLAARGYLKFADLLSP